MNKFSAIILLSFILTASAVAQSQSGVFGGQVKADTRAIEYRSGFTGDRGNGPGGFSHRIHYQEAFTENFQVRAVLFQRKIENEDWDFTAFRLETLFQLTAVGHQGFASAIRLDLHFADGDNEPGFLRLGWTGQFELSESISFRTNFLVGFEAGPGSRDDPFGGVRFQLQKTLDSGLKLGLESYHSAGDLSHPGSFDEQNHIGGPYFSGQLGDRLGYRVQYLAGLSASATDHQVRTFLSYGF